MDDGFRFVEKNGLDKEGSYGYTGQTGKCNTAKEKKADGIKPGAVTSSKDVQANSESQLAAAVTKGPVSVAIEADQSGFQFYKSGVFSGKCGTNLDHGETHRACWSADYELRCARCRIRDCCRQGLLESKELMVSEPLIGVCL